MNIELNIDDYLSYDEKKQLCIDYVNETLRGDIHHKERVLSNMAYEAAFAILDSVLTPEMMTSIREKATEQITKVSDFAIFRKKDAWGAEDSPAYLEVKKAVEENKHLIAPLVKKAIQEKDYSAELPKTADDVGYVLVDALVKGLQMESSL
jgi:hypothetical protein